MSFPPPPSSKHKGTQLLGLSEKDVAWIPWANPHHLFWTFIIRRIYHHDQLAALAAKRLFDTGEVSERWLKRNEHFWPRRFYNLAMAVIGKTTPTDEPIRGAPNNENDHDYATVDSGGNGQKRKMVSKGRWLPWERLQRGRRRTATSLSSLEHRQMSHVVTQEHNHRT